MIKFLVTIILLHATAAIAGDLPDRTLTPGAIDATLTAKRICAKSFTTKSVRNVSQSLKREVYAEYGMSPKKAPCPCEVDHLISLELGGSNDIRNLWPQSFGTRPWNARVKDALENRLHKLMCSGDVSQKQAQSAIRTNWITAYKRWVSR